MDCILGRESCFSVTSWNKVFLKYLHQRKRADHTMKWKVDSSPKPKEDKEKLPIISVSQKILFFEDFIKTQDVADKPLFIVTEIKPNVTNRQSDETKRESDETKKQSYETKKQSYETKKQSDETKRPSDESNKQSYETKKQSYEAKRQSDDNKRQSDDNKRQSDDNKRQSDDNKRQSDDNKRQSDDNKRQSDDNKRHSDETKKQSDKTDDEKWKEVVYDLVHDKYKERFQRLLNKIRKSGFTSNHLKVAIKNHLKHEDLDESANNSYTRVVEDLNESLKSIGSKEEAASPKFDYKNESFKISQSISNLNDENLYENVSNFFGNVLTELNESSKSLVQDNVKTNNSYQSQYENQIPKSISSIDFYTKSSETHQLQNYQPAKTILPNDIYAKVNERYQLQNDQNSKSILSNELYSKANETTNQLPTDNQTTKTISSNDLSAYYEPPMEYDEKEFLREALGNVEEQISEDYIHPRTISIASDNISLLLSVASSKVKRRRFRKNFQYTELTDSYYEDTTYNVESFIGDTSITTNDYKATFPSYEEITETEEEANSSTLKRKTLTKRVYVYETIIGQAVKILEYGRKERPGFIGSVMHAETERILLHSKIMRQAVINEIYSIEDPIRGPLGQVTIQNIKCSLNELTNGKCTKHRFYVCVLQYKTIVYCTKIAAANKLLNVDFEGCFVFQNLPSNFEIRLQVYVLTLPKIYRRQCINLPFLRRLTKVPLMKLYGENHVTMANVNRPFCLDVKPENVFPKSKICGSISTSVKWPGTLKGFLTVSVDKTKPLYWNRRWCVLEDYKLKYYNYPTDENYSEPINIINLKTCSSCIRTKAYMGQSTLCLEIGISKSFVHLSPDTVRELEVWNSQICLIMQIIEEWKLS